MALSAVLANRDKIHMVPPIERNTIPERAVDYKPAPSNSQTGAIDINALIQLHMLDVLDRKGGNGNGGNKPRDIELTESSRFRIDFRTVIVIVAIAGAWFDMRNSLSNLKTAQDSYKEAQATMQRNVTMLSKEFEEMRLQMVQSGIKIKIHDLD